MLAGTPAGSPALADNIGDKIDSAEDDLVEANAAVAGAAKSLEAARTQLPAARAAYAAAQAKLSGARQREAATADAVEQATAASIAAEERVLAAEDTITEMNGQIGDLARAVYTQGPYAELAAVLSAKTPSDFADQLEAIRAVSRSQNKALADLQAAKADLALASVQAQQALDHGREEAQGGGQGAQGGRRRRRRPRAPRRPRSTPSSLPAPTPSPSRTTSATRSRRSTPRSRRSRSASSVSPASAPTTAPASPAPPPATSRGRSRAPRRRGQVGWRVHPVYGYRSCHTGIDLSAGYGTAIRSAAAGKVVYVQNSGAYGLHTVVDHGNGIETMYAHQSSVAVSLGQIVSQGQTIGYVGSTGFSTGAHLHWEVHVNGVPYNPLGWFGGPKSVIACYNQI